MWGVGEGGQGKRSRAVTAENWEEVEGEEGMMERRNGSVERAQT